MLEPSAHKQAHRQDTEALINEAESHPETGLSQQEAEHRQKRYGPNKLKEAKKKTLWAILWDQINTPVAYLLAAAAVLSFSFGDILEGSAIVVVLIINAAIGFGMELQARKSMNALKAMDKLTAMVLRNGKQKEIDAQELVPGDMVELGEGCLVPADLRLIEVNELEINESPLTGESVPISKNTEVLDQYTETADRTNMAFKGTSVTGGKGQGLVVGTGMNTEIGSISEMAGSAEEETIPLNERLAGLSKTLIWVILVLAALLAVVGTLTGMKLYIIIQTAIAWAIAAIPEGLPIVASIALAKGMLGLAKKNVIVKRLASVESLGETNVIFTDKTGTLTENRLTVESFYLNDGIYGTNWKGTQVELDQLPKDDPRVEHLFKIAVLCNDAQYDPEVEHSSGDPLEIGLLRFAYGLDKDWMENVCSMEMVDEDPFDNETNFMGTIHKQGEQFYTAGKGATESLLDRCTKVWKEDKEQDLSQEEREEWLKRNDEMAEKGLRTLAFAYKLSDTQPQSDEVTFLNDMVLVGLVGFLDPPREEVKAAIDTCRKAGIRVVMVTGDHRGTANNIAYQVHLSDSEHPKNINGDELEQKKDYPHEVAQTEVFSRATPAQKLDIIRDFQEDGNIVGMTGDGVNDAPALKKADIGIAMGMKGTQVAKEAADMVLKDDAFTSILDAIREGRIVFGNIRRFVIYQLSYHLSEIMVIAAVMGLTLTLPLLPLQLLFLNILLDVFPALALGIGRGREGVMEEPPKDPAEPILHKIGWTKIVVYGFLIAAPVLAAYFYSQQVLGYSFNQINNIAFYSLSFAQLLNVFNMRVHDENFFFNQVTRNKWVWLAIGLCAAVLMLVYWIPFFSEVLSLQSMSPEAWVLTLVASLSSFVSIQIFKQVAQR